MKFLYALMIGAFALFGCGDAEKESDVTEGNEITQEESKEYVTEVITRTYSVNLDNGDPSRDTLQQMQSITVDSDGKEIEKTFYKLDSSVASVERYIYNEEGKLIGSDYFDNGINNTIYYAYETDSKGRKISYQAFDHGTDALLFEGATRYEDFGKLKKDGHLNEKGDFVCTFEYVLDDEGKEVEYTYIDDFLGERFSSSYQYVDFNDDKKWTKRYLMREGSVYCIETREFRKVQMN